jgi:hypothetical protein
VLVDVKEHVQFPRFFFEDDDEAEVEDVDDTVIINGDGSNEDKGNDML